MLRWTFSLWNMDSHTQLSGLLIEWANGDEDALNKLLPLVEMELRRIAHNFMRKENRNHTLQTTALVNEAYLKLIDQRDVQWQNRAHFFALSAKIMRRILLNHARDRIAEKRGGGAEHLDIEDIDIISYEKSRELVALDEALEILGDIDKTKAKIIELRYFAGLTIEETAEVMGIAAITVSTNWRFARAWLVREINESLSK